MPDKKPASAIGIETLNLSGYGDEAILLRIVKLINDHDHRQPYINNTLVRMKWLLDDHLGGVK